MNHVPVKLSGKDFEQALMDAAAREERSGNLTMTRYGTKSVTIKDDSDPTGKKTKTIQVPSLPDFEGVLWNGRQFIIEAKSCDGVSFEMRKEKIKPQQVEHMLRRDRFGVPCFLVIHFAERRGQNFFHPAITVALPVTNAVPCWQAYVDSHALAKKLKGKPKAQGSISRDVAQEMGELVPWVIAHGCRRALPNLMAFIGCQTPAKPRADQLQPSLF